MLSRVEVWVSEACGRRVKRRGGIDGVLGVGRVAGRVHVRRRGRWDVVECVCVLRTPVALDIFFVTHIGVRHFCADVRPPLGRWRERASLSFRLAYHRTIERCGIGGGVREGRLCQRRGPGQGRESRGKIIDTLRQHLWISGQPGPQYNHFCPRSLGQITYRRRPLQGLDRPQSRI